MLEFAIIYQPAFLKNQLLEDKELAGPEIAAAHMFPRRISPSLMKREVHINRLVLRTKVASSLFVVGNVMPIPILVGCWIEIRTALAFYRLIIWIWRNATSKSLLHYSCWDLRIESTPAFLFEIRNELCRKSIICLSWWAPFIYWVQNMWCRYCTCSQTIQIHQADAGVENRKQFKNLSI